PTYYVYQLYHQFGTKLVTTGSTDADVTVTAAWRNDGALTLMVVNPTVQPKSVTIDLTGLTPTGPAELWRLDPTHNATRIGTTDELTAGTLTLPAQSVSLYILAAPSGAATS